MKLVDIFQTRLSVKATVFFSAAIIVAAIFMVAISVSVDRKRASENAVFFARNMAQTTAATAASAMERHDLAALNHVYLQSTLHKGISGVLALDAEGSPLTKLDHQHLTRNMEADITLGMHTLAAGEPEMARAGKQVRFAVPVQMEQQTLGVVITTFDVDKLLPSLSGIILANMWKGLAMIAVGIPMALLVFFRLFRPLRGVIDVVQKAADGDLSARSSYESKDEFGVLSGSLNQMFERMKTNMDRTRWLAYGDQLTRLANKTAFSLRLRYLVDQEKSSGTLFLIDLDGFKRLNDAYGTDQGDAILITAANRLRKVAGEFVAILQQEDKNAQPMLARLSGNEFAFLAAGCVSAPIAQRIAQRILQSLAEPFELSGQWVNMSARIGVAMYPHDASDSKTLLGSVNFAIDVAKKNGGGTWQFFEPSMTQAAIRRVTLQNELQRALKNEEFIVHYQPKIHVRDGTTAGCEALVRWQKAPGKLVSPGAFIDVAEETGLINPIGDFVLEAACTAAAKWARRGMRCPVAVNVSSLQFARENFTTIVTDILERTGLSPELLELELTESVAMTNPDRLMEQVMPLKDRGVRFAIDDFGTGHSSLAYLSRLPFDVFKIDQSFVREMTEDKHARVIVQTVLAMAESLGYRTVAEGVETREHFAFLQLHCCDYIQGYYFSRPLPEAEFVERLEQERANLEQREAARMAG